MNIIVVTPKGKLYDETVDYVVITSDNNGEYAIMDNHIPIISSIDQGYIKMVQGDKQLFTVVINGIVEFSDNTVNIIAQEAHVGFTKDSAMDHLLTVREERLQENKRKRVDFAKAERELKKNVKSAKAGNL